MMQGISFRVLLLCTLVCAVAAILCPDKQRCEEDQTCCIMTSGKYGCCPFPSAICCSDKEHCCPSAHTCDLLHDRCISETGYSATPLGRAAEPSADRDLENSVNFAGHPKFNKLMMLLTNRSNQKCKDGSYCDTKATCCETNVGYACCPSPNAVCCSDKKHCCPHGSTCDPSSSTCRKGEYSPSGMLVISESGLQELEFRDSGDSEHAAIVVCPGGEDTCPEGSTCCQLASGDFGCCPFPNAVCCSDHSHCCPAGAQCDIAQEKCVFPFKTLEWAKKLPAQKTTKGVTLWTSISIKNEIICPDHKSKCAEGMTCCAAVHGYACCPYNHDVCCPDKAHCCPARTHCDDAKKTCDNDENSNLIEVPWATKIPALPISADVELGIVCPGGTAQCEAQQTCCKLRSGDWGCCPLPHAVCCNDKEHCCPSGSTCTAQGSCRSKTF